MVIAFANPTQPDRNLLNTILDELGSTDLTDTQFRNSLREHMMTAGFIHVGSSTEQSQQAIEKTEQPATEANLPAVKTKGTKKAKKTVDTTN